MDDWDSLQTWSSGTTATLAETMASCDDWGNTNTNKNSGRASQYCSECGAMTWNSCICLRSMDPEDEDLDHGKEAVQRVGTAGSEWYPVATDSYQSMTVAYQQGTVPCDKETLTNTTKPAEDTKAPIKALDDQETITACLNKLQSSLDDIKKDKEAMKQNLGESCLTFLHELKSFRKKIINHFDNMEKKAKSELNNLYEELDQNLRDDMSICDNTRDELHKISESLESDASNPNKNLNASMDNVKKKLENAKEVIKNLSKSDTRCKFKFAFHPTLQSVSSKVTSLGRFVFEQQYQEQEETDQAESQDLLYSSDVNIRHSSDAQSCCISGICQLPDGQTLLVDRDNQKLKCLDENYKITHYCELSAKPRSVCCVRSGKAAMETQDTFPNYTVAVSLSNNTVQYVDERKHELTLAASISFGHECWGLACLGNKLYISDWGSNVYVYDLSGTPVKTNNRSFICNVCGKKFVTKSYLNRHMKYHGEKKFKCDFEGCNYACVDHLGLRKHIRLMHTHKNYKPFLCSICPYKTGLRGNLDKHIRTVHNLEVVTKHTVHHRMRFRGHESGDIITKDGTLVQRVMDTRTPADKLACLKAGEDEEGTCNLVIHEEMAPTTKEEEGTESAKPRPPRPAQSRKKTTNRNFTTLEAVVPDTGVPVSGESATSPNNNDNSNNSSSNTTSTTVPQYQYPAAASYMLNPYPLGSQIQVPTSVMGDPRATLPPTQIPAPQSDMYLTIDPLTFKYSEYF